MYFIYDKETLYSLMNDFYAITKIKTVIFDVNYKSIVTVPEYDSDFCSAIHESKTATEKCNLCTLKGILKAKEENRLNIYKCHAGLIEAVAPIKSGDIIVGYMMLGQVLAQEDKTKGLGGITQYAKYYTDKNPQELFASVTSKSFSEIKSSAKIMESCVCYLLMNGVIKQDKGNTAFKIDKYINENISDNITVEALCNEFKISRNKLYSIADTFFGMPIAKYIKLKRIEKSSKLILEGVSVTLAAELTGFCDYGYFGKIFKSVTGKTPTQFKNN